MRVYNLIPSSFFVVAFLCFFLPFVDIKCGNAKTTSFSGFELAKGLKINKALVEFYKKQEKKQKKLLKVKEGDEWKLRVLLWSYAVSSFLGAVFSYLRKFNISSALGIISTFSLMIFWYAISSTFGGGRFINVGVSPPFWIATFSSICGVLTSFIFRRIRAPS